MNIPTYHEAPRGCGFRKPGGLYLISDGPGEPCSILPLPLASCPVCGEGVKPSRGWTWVQPEHLFGDYMKAHHPTGHSTHCPLSHPSGLGERAGLLWIGESFYSTPAEFTAEAHRMGISRRIKSVPKGFEVGQWVLLAHRKGLPVPDPCPRCGGNHDRIDRRDECPLGPVTHTPAVFHVFRPDRIEYVVKGDETDEELGAMLERGIQPVNVIPMKLEQMSFAEEGVE